MGWACSPRARRYQRARLSHASLNLPASNKTSMFDPSACILCCLSSYSTHLKLCRTLRTSLVLSRPARSSASLQSSIRHVYLEIHGSFTAFDWRFRSNPPVRYVNVAPPPSAAAPLVLTAATLSDPLRTCVFAALLPLGAPPGPADGFYGVLPTSTQPR